MNMMSVLLGATGLLLVAALILSMRSMSSGSDSKEIAALRAEIEQLNAAERELTRLRQGEARTPPTPTPTEVADANRIAEDAARIAALEEELAEKAREAEDAAQKADMFRDEAGVIAEREAEKTDDDSRRARIIREALLIATVTEYSAEDGFAVLNIQRHDNAQEGSTLAVRRNSGIIGQVQISSLYPDSQAVADPLPGTFLGGEIDIKPGDELIIPPL